MNFLFPISALINKLEDVQFNIAHYEGAYGETIDELSRNRTLLDLRKSEAELQAAIFILRYPSMANEIREAIDDVLKEYDDHSVVMFTPIAYFKKFDRLRELSNKFPKE